MNRIVCFRKAWFSILTFCILMLPVGALASPMLYTYEGNSFIYIQGNVYTSSMHVWVQLITKDGPIEEQDFGDISDQLLSWAFYDGTQDLNASDGLSELSAAEASVGSSGEILSWHFEASLFDGVIVRDIATIYLDIDGHSGFDYGGSVVISGPFASNRWALAPSNSSGWAAPMNPGPEPTIDAILQFFDQCVEDGTIEGYGPGNSGNNKLNALRNMLAMAGELINIGDIEGACGQLKAALKKCDDDSPPPDFVTGDAVTELYDMITELMLELGCE